jgi:hypothetical protein
MLVYDAMLDARWKISDDAFETLRRRSDGKRDQISKYVIPSNAFDKNRLGILGGFQV